MEFTFHVILIRREVCVSHLFSLVLFCPIMCLYVRCYVLWCPLVFRIKTMFGSSSCFVGGFMSYLRYLCAFGFFICLSSFCVLFTQCFQFLWIVHFVNTPSVFSNVYCITTYVYIYSTIMSRVCELFTHSFGRVFNITTQSFKLVTKDAL